MSRVEVIGDARLYLGNCLDILPSLPKVDAVITDPPYSERTHAGHDLIARGATSDGAEREKLGYAALSEQDVARLVALYSAKCDGWTVWMTDHMLAPVIASELKAAGRYVFAPLPFYQAGRSVRISGDGPSSWTDWIVVSRTKAQIHWGTLPGGYIAGPGWSDKARMGGKPTALMEALVLDYSRAGQTVLDSHMGAGTTGVACMRTGRKFIGCEVDAEAFDLSCRRIEQAYKQRPLFEAEPARKPEQLGLEAQS